MADLYVSTFRATTSILGLINGNTKNSQVLVGSFVDNFMSNKAAVPPLSNCRWQHDDVVIFVPMING